VPINAPPMETEARSENGVKFTIDNIISDRAIIFSTLARITTFLDHPTPIVHPPSKLETGKFLEFIAPSMPRLGVF